MGARVGRMLLTAILVDAAAKAGSVVAGEEERDVLIANGEYNPDEFRQAIAEIERRQLQAYPEIDLRPRRTSKGERKRNKHDRWR